MPCPRVATGLWHACALSWTYEKKHKKKITWRKTIAISNVFQKKL
jgi:hypothetical protein